MAPFLALIAVALLAPFAYDDEPAGDTLLWALVVAPGIVLTAAVVARLTSGLEASREAYRKLSGRGSAHRCRQLPLDDGAPAPGDSAPQPPPERVRADHARPRQLQGGQRDPGPPGRRSAAHHRRLDARPRGQDRGQRLSPGRRRVLGRRSRDRPRPGDAAGVARLEQALGRISSGHVRMGAAIGCAIFPQDGVDPAQLLDSADAEPAGAQARATARRPRSPR